MFGTSGSYALIELLDCSLLIIYSSHAIMSQLSVSGQLVEDGETSLLVTNHKVSLSILSCILLDSQPSFTLYTKSYIT